MVHPNPEKRGKEVYVEPEPEQSNVKEPEPEQSDVKEPVK